MQLLRGSAALYPTSGDLLQHEPYEAHHFGLRMVTPNEPTQELSIDEQRCSTHAVTDAGCDVGNARGLSRVGKVEVFPSADEYNVLTIATLGLLPVFQIPT